MWGNLSIRRVQLTLHAQSYARPNLFWGVVGAEKTLRNADKTPKKHSLLSNERKLIEVSYSLSVQNDSAVFLRVFFLI